MTAPTRQAVRFVFGVAALVLAAGPRVWAASPVWVDQRQVGPFLVQSTFDLRPHAGLLAELPELEKELRRVLALRPCAEPINLVLLADEREHRACVRERFPGAPHRRALFVKQAGRATVFAYRQAELAIDVRHECTHALLHADLPVLPLWLDEGLAEYFEMPTAERAFAHPHFASLRWRMRLGVVAGVAALEQKQQLDQMTLADYRASWAWVHYLLHGPREATEVLWAYLSDLRRGEPAGAFSERLARAMPDSQQRLAAHFRAWERLSLRKPPSRAAASGAGGEAGRRRPTSNSFSKDFR